MQAEIIPPGEEERQARKLAWRRRLMLWSAIVLGIAVAVGIVAVGFVVLAVAAMIGIAAWLVFAVLRWIGGGDPDSGFGVGRAGGGGPRPTVEIITMRGETLPGEPGPARHDAAPDGEPPEPHDPSRR